ncbi:MAG: condensation domain-containing protein [Promethearchaeota archaeon]
MEKMYKRKISAWERMMNHSPYSVVSMLVRVKGQVTEQMLRDAIKKLQSRHTLLRVRVEIDGEGTPWFTSEGIKEIPIEVLPRKDNNSWIEIYDKACRQPFDYNQRPGIRFYLLNSNEMTEILIFEHHLFCDGKSLAFLARDLMEFLGNPGKEVEILADPLPINGETIPKDHKLGGLMLKIVGKINDKLAPEKEDFDFEDYFELHKAYWKKFNHKTISIELTEEETQKIVHKSKENGVSVNSALASAFAGAQRIVQGKKPFHSKIGVGVDLRNRINPPMGESMGFYAGVVNPEFKYNPKKSMWDNAKAFHKTVSKLYTDKNFFKDPSMFSEMDPSMMEQRFYKILGGLVQSDSPKFEKISKFANRSDTLLSLLKRSDTDSLEKVIMGTAITNLTRMDFTEKYGDLELERLIMQPGGGFPLTTVNLVIGVVTCLGKMSIIMEYAEDQLNSDIAKEIKKNALNLLLN